ncbi:MAG: LON peptidase substrate-binding domain-containing protein [Acidobacteria bacterium]|nr:LON peptidase substrate-binding domain-containing protein [Acidobacteriota bacterium]
MAAPASGAGKAPIQLAAVLQESPAPEPLLPLFPLMLVLFPRTNLALHIFEERYKEMIRDCLQNQWEFGLLLVQEGVLETTGCTASITEVVRKYPDGRMDILVQGKRRFEISMLNQEKSYLRGQPQFFDDDAAEPSAELPRQQAIQLYRRLMELLEVEDELSKGTSPALNDPQLSFQMMAELPADLSWKQSLLSLRSERERLIRVNLYLQEWIDHLEGSPGQQPPAGKA